MKKVTNTATQMRELIDGLPGAIEASEARGQRELVVSEQLPAEIRPATGRFELESAGVKFGDPAPEDKLFVKASLPPSWKKRPTDHSMWSELVDDRGKVRAQIFYKAAFYDRWAFMNVVIGVK